MRTHAAYSPIEPATRTLAAYSSIEPATRGHLAEPRSDPMRGIMVSIVLGSLGWGALALLVISVRSLLS